MGRKGRRAERSGERCKRVSIDRVLGRMAGGKHADALYIGGDRGVVVEETGRPEYRDIVKVRETIERGLPGYGDVHVVAGVVHFRHSDAMFAKMLVAEQRRKPPIFPANCMDSLARLLRRLLGCTP